MSTVSVPVHIDDPVNTAILAVSEDQVQGFHRDPLGEIARRSAVAAPVVIERIRAMLGRGTIRRVRQTLMTTNLAEGALVAWLVRPEWLDRAFDYILREDPFTGHAVIRTAHPASVGSSYRLWTTVKVPRGYSLEKHCEYLAWQMGVGHYVLMPAKAVFVLGVGHIRRRGMQPGARSETPTDVTYPKSAELSDLDWRILAALKREFAPEELTRELWAPRAAEAGVPLETFYDVAETLDRRGLLGRFSTFLEHTKPMADGQRLTRFSALFHWAVPPGREIEAGREVGRHYIMTHAYWRESGPEFANATIMGMAHGLNKETLLAHKAAIDVHLEEAGIPVTYTNVFWGERSEIKPSEISPDAYAPWCEQRGLDPKLMRGDA